MNIDRKASVILLLTTILAACGWIFSKETIQGLPPFHFIGWRFLIASLCLLPLCVKQFLALSWRLLGCAAGVGVLLAATLLCWIHAVSISDTLGEGAFIISLSMLIVPMIAWLLFKEKPKRAFWIALPIAILGLAFLSLMGGWQQDSSQLWFAACALMLAIHFNINSLFARHIPVLLLTAIQLFVTGCIALCVSTLTETTPSHVASNIWVWFTLSALLATSLRYAMQTYGQKHSNRTSSALIMILEPVWTVILSVLWFGEVLSVNKLIGCGLILFALIFYRLDHEYFARLMFSQSKKS